MANDLQADTKIQVNKLDSITIVRQLGLFVGLAASIAIGFWVVLWSQEPHYGVLFSSIDEQEASEVLDALQQLDIPFRLDESTGAVLVPSKKVRDVRIKLAAQGLPKSVNSGYSSFGGENGTFGVSQAKEKFMFQKALEHELSKTISSLNNVKSTRIHLAIPRQSVFVRDKQKTQAAVTLNLYSGRTLGAGQVAAIAHLISSSVPNLSVDQVTVVDQKGRLLSTGESSREMALTSTQFDYTRKIERNYIDRIENILAPILGKDAIRAQVTADIDFTYSEQTQQSYDPDVKVPVSEQISEESITNGLDGGIPGALSNKPPGASNLSDKARQGLEKGSASNRSSRKEVRNYELDKTLSHTRFASGGIKRLSVAVVVDDVITTAKTGETTSTQRSPEELERITELVKKAMGFNLQRGDSINVINATFAVPEMPEALPEAALWEKPWVWDVVKQVLGGGLVLFILFGVLKPVIKSLSRTITPVFNVPALEGQGAQGANVADDQLSLSDASSAKQLAAPATPYETNMQTVNDAVNKDPKLVAQVVKSWVAEE